jgi:hypothetical protein
MATQITYFRAANPVWIFRDLVGEALDDTYYAHFLTNTLPYIPQAPFDGPTASANPWPAVLQFNANGALPNNLYFDDDLTYRIEIRQGPTQSDQLIYEIENFNAENSGGGTNNEFNIHSDNVITNPQFNLVNFNETATYTGSGSSDVYEIAPGWDIVVGGTNYTVVVTQTFVSSDQNLPGQAPQFVTINPQSSVDDIYIRQRFNGNGGLFLSTDEITDQRYVSGFFAAKTESSTSKTLNLTLQTQSGQSVDIITRAIVDQQWDSFADHSDEIDISNDAIVNPRWVDMRLSLPNDAAISLTSMQLVSQSTEDTLPYEQEPIERQIDHTWHYYKDSVLIQPKDSFLSGWDFALNPWQNKSTSLSAPGAQTAYVTDQTIIHQQTGTGKVNVGRGNAAHNYSLQVQAAATDSRFALIQYISPQTIRGAWGNKLSSLVRAYIETSNSSEIKFKIRLIYRTTLPATLSATEPVSSWTGSGDPADGLSAGWSSVKPKGDPQYTLETTSQNFSFDQFDLSSIPSSSDNMTLGILLYTVDGMAISGTADVINFESISLVPNDFAIDSNILTFDQTLSRCQAYYETSYIGSTPQTANNQIIKQMSFYAASNSVYPASFDVSFKTAKIQTPTLTIYNPSNGTSAQVQSVKKLNAAPDSTNNTSIPGTGFWNGAVISNYGFHHTVVSNQTINTLIATFGNAREGYIRFHYLANSRLGK